MARTVPVTTKDEYCEFGTPDDGEDVSGRSLPSDPALVYHVILSHLLNTCPVQSAANNPEKNLVDLPRISTPRHPFSLLLFSESCACLLSPELCYCQHRPTIS